MLKYIGIFSFLAPTTTAAVKTQMTKPKVQISSGQTLPPVKIETEDSSLKRKREDEDYDV